MSRSTTCFLGVAVALLFLLATVPLLDDFGTTWDFGQVFYGERYLQALLGEGGEPLDFDRPQPAAALRVPNLEHHRTEGPDLVWPLGPELAAGTHRIFHQRLGWLPSIAAYHLSSTLSTALLLALLVLYGIRRLGGWETLLGVALLAAHPGYLWHSLANFKDPPAAALFVLSSLTAVEALRRPRAASISVAGALLGLAVAAKGNGLFVPVAVLLAVAAERGVAAWWQIVRRPRAVLLVLWGAAVVAPLVAWLLWPWLWQDTGEHLARHVNAIRRNRSGGGEAFGGLLYAFATLPVVTLIGLLLSPLALWPHSEMDKRRAATVRVLLALMLVPLVQASWPGAKHYDAVRRYLEFLPPLALVAGVGWISLLRRLRSPRVILRLGSLGVALAAAWPAIRSHPDQHVFYNALVGGSEGARERGWSGAVDFWGHSYRRVFEWLAESAPPGARVVTPTGPQVARLCNQLWGRPDLRLTGTELWEVPDEPFYLALVYRPEYFNLVARFAVTQLEPVFEVSGSGVILASVYRVEPGMAHGDQLTRVVDLARQQKDARITEVRAQLEQTRDPRLLLKLAYELTLRQGFDAALAEIRTYEQRPEWADQQRAVVDVVAYLEQNRTFHAR